VQPVRLLVDKVADDVSMGAQVCRVEYEGYDSLVIPQSLSFSIGLVTPVAL
jgi:hypothetical protein